MQKLERTTFETSRAAEYFDARELQAQTGQPASNFAAVALKELMDNALDACETADVAPEVRIGVRDGGRGWLQLAVMDSGPGIPPQTVHKVLDYDVRVSDKAAYRSPTRGAQGNALKTVIGIPYALGVRDSSVTVVGRGVKHKIKPWIDPAGELRVEHNESPALEEVVFIERAQTLETEPVKTYKSGVSLFVPTAGQDFDPAYWARAFAMFNPHATVILELAQMPDPEFVETYKRSVLDGWRKYMPTDLTSAHWYTPASMQRLVFSHIGHAERNGGRDLPLGEFIRQFRGLSNPSKAKAVREGFPDITHLSGFADRPEQVADLLAAMQARSKAPSHNVFGRVGPDRFRAIFERSYEVGEFTYQWAKDYTAGELPYIFEIAVAVTSEPGHLYYGVNFSPTFDDPLEGTLLAGPKFKSHGIRGFLQHSHALPRAEGWYSFRSPAKVAVAVHIVTPAPVFLDRGKTRIQLEEEDEVNA
jgi:hypothetical protein